MLVWITARRCTSPNWVELSDVRRRSRFSQLRILWAREGEGRDCLVLSSAASPR